MKNPIKENRLVCDYTFATRFKSFMEDMRASDPCMEDEIESMQSYAKQLIRYQAFTATDNLEIAYLKRVGNYHVEPVAVTEDGVKILEFPFTIFGVMKDPKKGDQILTWRIHDEEAWSRMNKNRAYFLAEELAKEYKDDNEKIYSKADLKKFGINIVEN